jgi:hypothetical protein
MAQERKEKRLGRPVKAPTPGKRVSLGLKVTAEIKQRIDEEARKSGRTQSQQAELMIERGFEQEQQIVDVFGSHEIYGLARTLGVIVDSTRRMAGFEPGKANDPDAWIHHPYAYDQVVKAVTSLLETLRPPGKIEQPRINLDEAHRALEPKIQEMLGRLGENVTEAMILATSGAYSDERLKEGKNLRTGLGWLAAHQSKEKDK